MAARNPPAGSSSNPSLNGNFNIIQQTRDIVQNMNQEQRFKKAKRHFMDAIENRYPRNDFETSTLEIMQISPLSLGECTWFRPLRPGTICCSF